MMKRIWLVVAVAVFCAGLSGSRAETDLVVQVMPASLLINAGSDDFAVIGPTGQSSDPSNVYLMPNFSLGAGIEVSDFLIDLSGGAGIVVNDSFQSFMLQATVGAYYAATDSLDFGPRLGLIYFTDPDWEGDGDVELDSDLGFLAGLQVSMGDRILYVFSVDVIAASFDAEAGAGWSVAEDELEFVGMAVQFGVRGRF